MTEDELEAISSATAKLADALLMNGWTATSIANLANLFERMEGSDLFVALQVLPDKQLLATAFFRDGEQMSFPNFKLQERPENGGG